MVATDAEDTSKNSNPYDRLSDHDPLGIYTGLEADAVLNQSHSHWQAAVRAARAAPHGQSPSNAFDLKPLLLRIPALPDSIPCDAIYLKGYSTWVNSSPIFVPKKVSALSNPLISITPSARAFARMCEMGQSRGRFSSTKR